MAGKNQHVIPHGSGWAVRGAGNNRAMAIYETQRDAIEHARGIAQNQGSENLVHGQNGRIRDRDSYGNDPYPPKG